MTAMRHQPRSDFFDIVPKEQCDLARYRSLPRQPVLGQLPGESDQDLRLRNKHRVAQLEQAEGAPPHRH